MHNYKRAETLCQDKNGFSPEKRRTNSDEGGVIMRV
nr:MAG TPA: hypothetical protein [Caudoviricetes sp.]